MTIYGPGLGTLWRILESYGFDPHLVISEADFTPGDGAPRRHRLPYERYDRLRSKAVDLIDDPLIGLRSADHIHPSHFGALGHAWMASSSLLTGIRLVERYGRMTNEQERWLIEEGTHELSMAVELLAPVQRVDEVADSLIAGMTALCRLNFGQGLNPERVTFVRPAPEDPGPWFSFFQCPVVFGSDANRLVISMKKATKPLSGSDQQIVALHESVIQRYLAGLDRGDILNRARIEITDRLPSGGVSEGSVAQALNMTKRTLHRRLREHGASFRSLLTDVRKNLVAGYLKDDALNLTEIAFLLGYSDASAFSRAFRRWFGKSPGAMRSELIS
jgi:AraC-like DNA-binding protein